MIIDSYEVIYVAGGVYIVIVTIYLLIYPLRAHMSRNAWTRTCNVRLFLFIYTIHITMEFSNKLL